MAINLKYEIDTGNVVDFVFNTSQTSFYNKPKPSVKASADKFIGIVSKVPSTQKAKGIHYLVNSANHYNQLFSITNIASSFVFKPQEGLEIKDIGKHPYFEYWEKIGIRPCPPKPRHGYEESRYIPASDFKANLVEINNKLLELKETDAEILIVQAVDAACNAVVTPCRIVVGEGNAGATSGENCVEMILKTPTDVNSYFKNFAVPKGFMEYPFFEMILPKVKKDWSGYISPELVQMRDGPDLTKPLIKRKKVKITEVHKVDIGQDLLEWDAFVPTLKEKQTTTTAILSSPVIWHPGGSTACHYGVHAAINGIPYITSEEEPKVGTVVRIRETSFDTKDPDFNSLKSGILEGLTADINFYEYRMLIHTAVGMLHLIPNLNTNNPLTMRFLGYIWGLCVRIFSALPVAESRHCKYDVQQIDNLKIVKNEKWQREGTYKNAGKIQLNKLFGMLGSSISLFAVASLWNSGYGGKPWHSCADALHNVIVKMLAMVKKPDLTNYNNLVGDFNLMINQVHNNGWWLNKISTQQTFDLIPKQVMLSISPSLLLKMKNKVQLEEELIIKMFEDAITALESNRVEVQNKLELNVSCDICGKLGNSCDCCHKCGYKNCECCSNCNETPDNCECPSEECGDCGEENCNACDTCFNSGCMCTCTLCPKCQDYCGGNCCLCIDCWPQGHISSAPSATTTTPKKKSVSKKVNTAIAEIDDDEVEICADESACDPSTGEPVKVNRSI